MIKITEKEAGLIGDLLEMAADRFSNDGCTEYRLEWPAEECAALHREYHRWNGDEKEVEADGQFDPENPNVQMFDNWILMGHFSRKLRGE